MDNDKLIEENKELLHRNRELSSAIEYYQAGVGHFFECINWGKSFLDSDAVMFMNDHGIIFTKAISQTKEPITADAEPKAICADSFQKGRVLVLYALLNKQLSRGRVRYLLNLMSDINQLPTIFETGYFSYDSARQKLEYNWR